MKRKKTFYVTKDYKTFYRAKSTHIGLARLSFIKKYGREEGEMIYAFQAEDGLNPFGLYVTRYYARKNAASDEITVKANGGYRNMKYDEYLVWRKQK